MSTNLRAYRIFSEHVVERMGDEAVVAYVGCNGVNHATDVDRLSFDDNGNVIDGEHLGGKVVGPCDGTCKTGEKLGGFLFNGQSNE